MRGKCPFNNFEPCREDCQLYLGIIDATAEYDKDCMFIQMGTALVSIEMNGIKVRMIK
jgi:hypothetical protein